MRRPVLDITSRRWLHCRATPNPCQEGRGRGNHVVWGESRRFGREAQALSALARQLTPQADERGCSSMPRVIALLFLGCLCLILPASAGADTSSTGGAQFPDQAPIVAPGSKATLLPDGTAAAPA